MSELRRIIDMTPAERKAEALAILAKKKLSYSEMRRIDALTRFQFAGGYGADINLYHLEEFLKLFEGRRIALSNTNNYPDKQWRWRVFVRGCSVHTSGKTLKIALLKAYWRLVPDEPERETA